LLTLLAKKEVFEWLKIGRKTIDIRRGKPKQTDKVLFVSGPNRLEMRVVGIQSGRLNELIRQDNFRQIIPSAESMDDAIVYLCRIYGAVDCVFTAYFVVC